MILILIAAVLIIILCILGIILIQVKNENLRRWTVEWLVKSGSTPVPEEPDNPANLVYLNDMAFNVRVVISFVLAFLALIMLAVIVATAGIGIFRAFF